MVPGAGALPAGHDVRVHGDAGRVPLRHRRRKRRGRAPVPQAPRLAPVAGRDRGAAGARDRALAAVARPLVRRAADAGALAGPPGRAAQRAHAPGQLPHAVPRDLPDGPRVPDRVAPLRRRGRRRLAHRPLLRVERLWLDPGRAGGRVRPAADDRQPGQRAAAGERLPSLRDLAGGRIARRVTTPRMGLGGGGDVRVHARGASPRRRRSTSRWRAAIRASACCGGRRVRRPR